MPIQKIIKRDGRIVDFDITRIANAIFKAARAVGGEDYELACRLARQVVSMLEEKLKPGEIPTVEQVQDVVEKVLVENGHYKTAKAYILYRKQHEEIRKVRELFSNIELVDRYLDEADWRVRENSNMTYSLQGLNFHVSSVIASQYWLEKIYPPEIKEAHLNGDLHIHDLGILGAYCVGWDLREILLSGFKGVRGKVASRPPRHFRSALGQLVNFLFTLQGEAAGAQAVSNLDTLLAPFIRFDNLDYKAVKQCLQEFIFNLNVPTRVGFQSLAYEVPVIVRKNGAILIERIGKLVEEEFAANRERVIPNVDGYGNPSPDSLMVLPKDDYYALGFDKDGRVRWLKIRGFVKHRVSSKRFKRVRTRAGVVRISPAHSLFRLEGNSIAPVTPEQLRTTRPNRSLTQFDHVLAVGKLDSSLFKNAFELDLADLISQLPASIRGNIFVIVADRTVKYIRRKLSLFYGSLKQLAYEHGRRDKTALLDHFAENVLPFDIWLKWTDDRDEDVRFYVKPYPDRSYRRYIRGEELEAFVELSAWYVSEGKASGSRIIVSQAEGNEKEIERALETLGASYRRFLTTGWSSKRRERTGTRIVNLEVFGLYALLLQHLAGASAREKRIPSFIFDLAPHLRKKFFETLIAGDGSFEKTRISFSSSSDKLLTGLSLLALSLGYSVSVVRKDPRRSASTLLIYPGGRIKAANIKAGDLIGVPVYEIEDVEYDWEWEYDISVEAETENFAGGPGLILFHNTPFTNVTLDLKVPDYMKDEPVIYGGKVLDMTYGEFQEEVEIFNEAFAEVMLEGDADGRAFSFPIPTYNITKDFDWDNPRYEKIWLMTAKYGIPYFSNFINSDMRPEDARSMCCRLRLDTRELRKRGGGLFGANPLTGSIGVVTINMPRLGYLSRNESDFFRRLDHLMYLAKESLEIKRKVLERLTERGLYPYSKFYLRSIKERFGEYWKNHFSTIGLVGMNECCLNLFGRDIGSEVGLKFAIKVLDHMREKLMEFQEETGNIYNLEATPAEGASYRLAMIDKKKFPDIVVANEEAVKKGAQPYYTNSTQLPVWYTDDLFEALRLQEPLQTRYTGGTVFHIFIGEEMPPPESVKALVRKICENFSIPYFTITPTFSVCPEHGYLFGKHELCPKCLEMGKETRCEVFSRIVGYLRPVDQWNDGKQAEFRERRYFKLRE